jgi:hypothetical protein
MIGCFGDTLVVLEDEVDKTARHLQLLLALPGAASVSTLIMDLAHENSVSWTDTLRANSQLKALVFQWPLETVVCLGVLV